MPEPEGVDSLPRLHAKDLYAMWVAALLEGGISVDPWDEVDDQQRGEWVTFARLIRNHFRRTP